MGARRRASQFSPVLGTGSGRCEWYAAAQAASTSPHRVDMSGPLWWPPSRPPDSPRPLHPAPSAGLDCQARLRALTCHSFADAPTATFKVDEALVDSRGGSFVVLHRSHPTRPPPRFRRLRMTNARARSDSALSTRGSHGASASTSSILRESSASERRVGAYKRTIPLRSTSTNVGVAETP